MFIKHTKKRYNVALVLRSYEPEGNTKIKLTWDDKTTQSLTYGCTHERDRVLEQLDGAVNPSGQMPEIDPTP